MENGIERLARSIGYPDEIQPEARSYVFEVDGLELRASVVGERVRLTGTVFAPPRDGSRDETLVRLADCATGRILKEEAVLAWDPDVGEAILWQEFPAKAEMEDLRRFFEVFAASMEWWLERVSEEESPRPAVPEFVILP